MEYVTVTVSNLKLGYGETRKQFIKAFHGQQYSMNKFTSSSRRLAARHAPKRKKSNDTCRSRTAQAQWLIFAVHGWLWCTKLYISSSSLI